MEELYSQGRAAYDKREYQEALPLLTQAAELGHREAQFYLGKCLHFGYGTEEDRVKAGVWYGKAAEQGHGEAQRWMGIFCQKGICGQTQDYEKALQWYQKAQANGQRCRGNMQTCQTAIDQHAVRETRALQAQAERGEVEAQVELGRRYSAAYGVPEDPQKSFFWYSRAAEQGSAKAWHRLGLHYNAGSSFNASAEKALECFLKAVELDYPAAYRNLYDCYSWGGCVEKDEVMALRYLREGAELGVESAQYNLGLRYYHDTHSMTREFEKTLSFVKAIYWYRKSERGPRTSSSNQIIEEQVAKAQKELEGRDVRADFAALEVLAETGDPKAQIALGECCETGSGTERDLDMAERWYVRAADRGDQDGQYHAGRMAEREKDSPDRFTAALSWYTKAAAQGHVGAKARQRRLEGQREMLERYWRGKAAHYRGDHAETVRCFRETANQGFSRAQCGLAICYENGMGVEKSLREALRWALKAAEQGDVDGQRMAGRLYCILPENADPAEGLRWLRDAVAQGDQAAAELLPEVERLAEGHIFDEGSAAYYREDFRAALVWFRKGAELGFAKEQFNLAMMYGTGKGVPRNMEEARKWFQAAADQGLEEAKEVLRRL